jgi:hypothetical protein
VYGVRCKAESEEGVGRVQRTGWREKCSAVRKGEVRRGIEVVSGGTSLSTAGWVEHDDHYGDIVRRAMLQGVVEELLRGDLTVGFAFDDVHSVLVRDYVPQLQRGQGRGAREVVRVGGEGKGER